MPISVQPIEPALILHYRFSGQITRDDLERVQDAEASYFQALGDGDGVTVIADMASLHTIGANLFSRLRNLRMVRDRRVRRVIVVGANPYLRALALSLGSIESEHEFIFRPTLADALQSVDDAVSV